MLFIGCKSYEDKMFLIDAYTEDYILCSALNGVTLNSSKADAKMMWLASVNKEKIRRNLNCTDRFSEAESASQNLKEMNREDLRKKTCLYRGNDEAQRNCNSF